MGLGILGGIGMRYALYKGGDYMAREMVKNILEEQLSVGLGEQAGDNIEISDPKVLEGLGITVPAQEETSSPVGESGENPGELEQPEVKPESVSPSNDQEGAKSESVTPSQGATNQTVAKEDLQKAVDQKVDEVTSKIPSSDKVRMAQLIVSRVGKGDINYLASLMADGISSQDIAIAKQVAKANFQGEELEEVKKYYKKYAGLVLGVVNE